MNDIRSTEEIIVKLLRIGVLISATLIMIGLIMMYIKGGADYKNSDIASFGVVFKGILEFEPVSIIMLGLLVLIITPVLRVAISLLVFAREKDYLYVKVTAVVLFILVISFFIGIYS